MIRNPVGLPWRGRSGTEVGSRPRSQREKRQRLRPAVLALEDRMLLSFTVLNTSDSGNGSLRYEIGLANAAGGTNTVDFNTNPALGTNFNTPQTITLTSGLLDVTDSGLTIMGPAAGVTLSGNNNSRLFSVESGAGATFWYLTITGGNSGSDYGGGLYNRGTLILNDCTVSNDTAGSSYYGGGLYNLGGTAYLNNCTFSHDSAGEHGGGVYNGTKYNFNGGPNRGVLNLTNCTFSDDKASNGYYGGGLYNSRLALANVVNCTFSGDTAAYGGGVYNYGGQYAAKLTMRGTIVAGNSGSSGGPDVYGSVQSIGNNLIGKTDDSSGWVGTDKTGTIATPLNPLLTPLGNFGGPTQTVALLPDSPAIHMGTETGLQSTDYDQRGFALDSPPDIGAFQTTSWGTTPIPLVVNSSIDPGSVPGTLSLRQAVNLANVLTAATAISFDKTAFATAQTITLTSGQLELGQNKPGPTETITITGPAPGLTVSGGGQSRVFQVDSGVTAFISGLTITGGGGMADRGGGLLNYSGNVTLTNCSVSGNSAKQFNNTAFPGNGGGIANYGTATLKYCSVSGNSAAKSGGGLFNKGTEMLTNCTVSGNSAGSGGGAGLYNNGTLTLSSCTASANWAAHWAAAGLFNTGGTATLLDTIVAGNTDAAKKVQNDIQGGQAVANTSTYNLIGPGGSGGLTNGAGHNIILPPSLAGLGLAPLNFYGGPTQSMALLPGSMAIKAGTASGITTDQRGFPLDSAVDIGDSRSTTHR